MTLLIAQTNARQALNSIMILKEWIIFYLENIVEKVTKELVFLNTRKKIIITLKKTLTILIK